MIQIIWSNDAIQDLENIYAYIHKDSPEHALAVFEEIKNKAEHLSIFPLMGIAGRIPDTRELLISKYPYIVIYKTSHQEIYISAVFRDSQNYKS